MFAHGIFTETLTLVGAKETSCAAGDATNHAPDRCAKRSRCFATLLCIASGISGNSLGMNGKRESEKSGYRYNRTYFPHGVSPSWFRSANPAASLLFR